MLKRKITFRMYPNVAQTERLDDLLGIHLRVYNTAIEERIRAYEVRGESLTFAMQCKELTQWRARVSALALVNAQSLQVTIKRVDLAFAAFFRRLLAGEKPGFPRFKSIQRFSGWGYKTHGDGWKLHAGECMQHGYVRLSGVGMVRLRGKARTSGEIKTAEVMHKLGKWYLSVTVACEPQRTAGDKAVGIDWGLETFATVVDHSGETQSIANPRFLNAEQQKHLTRLQKEVSRKPNKRSKNRRKAVTALARKHSRVANRRKDFLHKTSASLVSQCALIATETLNIKGMTSGGCAYKKGLNRSILDTAPFTFLTLLKSKAEEAGLLWYEVPTRQVKPSQTCHRCGIQQKKSLAERRHCCTCGVDCSRDENAARVMLNWALTGSASGQELAEVGSGSCFTAMNHETHAVLVV